MSLISKLESILFVASKPLSVKKMASVLPPPTGGVPPRGGKNREEEVLAALESLRVKYNNADSGITILQNGDEYQMVANPENKDAAENFLKAEVSGELTRPQLETLTVISYCGPITKPELEQIRGVNCSLILRNLMLRGLVKENEGSSALLPSYQVTMDYLRHLGLNSLTELPNYAELHNHPYIANLEKEE